MAIGREAPIRINETTDRGLHKFSRDFSSYTLLYFFFLFSCHLLLISSFLFYLTTGFPRMRRRLLHAIYTAITKSRTFRWL